MVILLTYVTLLWMNPPAGAEQTCRPSFAEAIERARRNCHPWGCGFDVTRSAAILAANPHFTAAEVMADISRRRRGDRIDPGTAVVLLAELGMLENRTPAPREVADPRES